MEDRTRDLLGKVNQQAADGVLSGTSPTSAPGQGDPASKSPTPIPELGDPAGAVSASPAANGAPAGSLPATPVSSSDGPSYAACLDDFYPRVSDDYSIEHWLPAAVWFCRDLAPAPQNRSTASQHHPSGPIRHNSGQNGLVQSIPRYPFFLLVTASALYSAPNARWSWRALPLAQNCFGRRDCETNMPQ